MSVSNVSLNAGSITFFEPSPNGTEYVKFNMSSALSASYQINIPTSAPGGSNRALVAGAGLAGIHGSSWTEIVPASGGTFTGNLVVTGNFEPEADATRNLGASNKRWANIYSADLQLSNEGSANEVDGTWGQYTIQEGEEDLFLINRRNGKKYKFVLQEVG